jgi:hypothetical protein
MALLYVQSQYPKIMQMLDVIICEASGAVLAPLIAAGTPTRDIFRFFADVHTVRSGLGRADTLRGILSFVRGLVESITENNDNYSYGGYKPITFYDKIMLNKSDLLFIDRQFKTGRQNVSIKSIDGDVIHSGFSLESVRSSIEGYNEQKRQIDKEVIHQELGDAALGIATGSVGERSTRLRKDIAIADVADKLCVKKTADNDAIMLRLQAKLDNPVTNYPIVSCSENRHETEDEKMISVVSIRFSLPPAYADSRIDFKTARDIRKSVRTLFSSRSSALNLLGELNQALSRLP